MKIIINADDLGASARVNDRIFALMSRGRVTSASLMMNAPAVEDAVHRLREYPNCSFGVHLNVTEFFPLTVHPGLRPLLTDGGEFAGNARRIPLTPAIREAVFEEWSAQVERALTFAVPVSHLDSHHHVHTEPHLFGVLKKIQRKFSIRKVRLTQNVVRSSESMSAKLRISKAVWNFALRNFYLTKTTEGFTAFSAFYDRLQAGVGSSGVIELMSHPGSEAYERETKLIDGSWRETFAPKAKLISYLEL